MVRNGFGKWGEVIELKEKYGLDYLLEIQYILSILNQEDELDANQGYRSR